MTGLSSSADPAVCQRAGFAEPGSQEGEAERGPFRAKYPHDPAPRPGQSSQQCFHELVPRPSLPAIRLSFPKCPTVRGQSHDALPHPMLCYLQAWPWYLKTLAQGFTAEQNCAVDRPASHPKSQAHV